MLKVGSNARQVAVERHDPQRVAQVTMDAYRKILDIEGNDKTVWKINSTGKDEMIILGIHQGHDSSASLVIDGKVIANVAEERFTRLWFCSNK